MQSAPQRGQNTADNEPARTLTFAFTDIEGSTARWERDAAAMQEALQRHDAILHAAIAQHRGRVFKCVGDAFCAVFARPADAVAAMVAAERALAAEDFSTVEGLRIRAAVHSGACEERDGDYFGTAVNRVARLLAIAHGGQVLVSGATHELVAGERLDFRDLGAHRLKDLAQPERVYQLLAEGLEAGFPPLRSMSALANNLPQQVSTFVGRDEEVAEIADLVESQRLVTIVGSGGVGKTRTALQVGAQLIDRATDGVWLVELAPLSSGDYVAAAIAGALSLTLPAGADALESLAASLTSRKALLVLDNCEHLIDAAGGVVSAILKRCPGIRVLATSRQSLQVGGEHTYQLPSLAPEQALQLFADRATAADHRFVLTPQTKPIVEEVCRRVDGIPLAIELAAARVKIFSPQQLRDRLDERFRVLTGGVRTALPRQQTLRALIDWSYDLLTERERAVFRRLSIFVDGFVLDGAAAVAQDNEMDELDVLDALQSLVDKSLVLASQDSETARYRMLESTRAYGREKLEGANESTQTAERHFRYFRDRFQAQREDVKRTHNRMGLRTAVVGELQDLRAALSWALGRDPVTGAELAAAVLSVWGHFNIASEGIDWLNRYLAVVPDTDARLKFQLWAQMRFMPGAEGQFHAASEALRYARLGGDRADVADALHAYAYACAMIGKHDEARAAVAEAFEIAPSDDGQLRMVILSTKAVVHACAGEYDAAIAAFEVARRSQAAVGDADNVMICDQNIADAEFLRGNTARAIEILQTSIATNATSKLRKSLLMQRIDLCGYLAFAGRASEAAVTGSQAVREAGSSEETILAVRAVEMLGFVRALESDLEASAKIAAYTKRAFERLRYDQQSASKRIRARYDAALHEALSAEDLARLSAEGEVLNYAQATALALPEV